MSLFLKVLLRATRSITRRYLPSGRQFVLSVPKCGHPETRCFCTAVSWHIGHCLCSSISQAGTIVLLHLLYTLDLALCSFCLFCTWRVVLSGMQQKFKWLQGLSGLRGGGMWLLLEVFQTAVQMLAEMWGCLKTVFWKQPCPAPVPEFSKLPHFCCSVAGNLCCMQVMCS